MLRLIREGAAATAIEHRCTVSIGAALFGKDDVVPNEILERADAAMYEAKKAGRNAIRFYVDADQSAA